MKQTAVEWLGFQLNMLFTDITEEQWDKTEKLFQQAKEMEKEQIEKAFEEGMFHHTSGLCPDEYYEETFKSE